ncbi:MAG: hypothetical protein AAFY98_09310 [Verrucomicrobiota bacterium]
MQQLHLKLSKMNWIALFLIITHASVTSAADRIIQKNGTERVGTIMGLTKNGNRSLLNFKFEGGQVPIPMKNVRTIELEERPQFAEGKERYEANEFEEAIKILRPLVNSYAGIESGWVAEALGMLTDSLIQTGKTFAAKEWGERLQELYPDSPYRLKGEITRARTMFRPDKVDGAIEILNKVLEELPKKAVHDPATMRVYSSLHTAFAEAHEIKGNKQEALQNYLLVATVYYQPESKAADALKNADRLRSANPDLAVN